jgi:hypothetical protein
MEKLLRFFRLTWGTLTFWGYIVWRFVDEGSNAGTLVKGGAKVSHGGGGKGDHLFASEPVSL